MKFWQNKHVLITGVGSGIGQALCYELAAKGAKLLVTDINAENLNKTVSKVKDNVIFQHVADAGSDQQWQYIAQVIENQFGHLDVLINNAGVLHTDFFEVTSSSDFNHVINTNLNGVVYGVRNMLPLLKKSKRGKIANISSMFGLVGGAKMTAYSTSKFAIRGFSESLRLEFMLSKMNVDVVCVNPGGVKTNIIHTGKTNHTDTKGIAAVFDKNTMITPKMAAKKIAKGIRKNKARILIGPDALFVDLLQRIFPRHYYKLFAMIFLPKKFYGK